jgi:hypothetical protein
MKTNKTLENTKSNPEINFLIIVLVYNNLQTAKYKITNNIIIIIRYKIKINNLKVWNKYKKQRNKSSNCLKYLQIIYL